MQAATMAIISRTLATAIKPRTLFVAERSAGIAAFKTASAGPALVAEIPSFLARRRGGRAKFSSGLRNFPI